MHTPKARQSSIIKSPKDLDNHTPLYHLQHVAARLVLQARYLDNQLVLDYILCRTGDVIYYIPLLPRTFVSLLSDTPSIPYSIGRHNPL